MKNLKWILFAVALGMIVATGAWLQAFRANPRLGPPGVRVSNIPIYNDKGQLAATQSVVLPREVLGIPALPEKDSPITCTELEDLPQDTTFGRRVYQTTNANFRVQLSVVLMGSDHTSIHQPQYCLYAQNWTITNMERITIPMDPPYEAIPAVKISATQKLRNGQQVSCVYIYWFVSGNKITAEEGSRLRSMWKTLLEKGVLERWAYISYFDACLPGTEESTFAQLKDFIRASAPQFQLVKGNRSGGATLAANQK